MERSPAAWKMTQDLWAAGGSAKSQGPGTASLPPSVLVLGGVGHQPQGGIRIRMVLWAPPTETEGPTEAWRGWTLA